MRYRIYSPVVLTTERGVRYIAASERMPAEFDAPADLVPSRTWTPLDDEARAAVKRAEDRDLRRAVAANPMVEQIARKYSLERPPPAPPFDVLKGK